MALFHRCLAYFNVIAIPPRSALTIILLTAESRKVPPLPLVIEMTLTPPTIADRASCAIGSLDVRKGFAILVTVPDKRFARDAPKTKTRAQSAD